MVSWCHGPQATEKIFVEEFLLVCLEKHAKITLPLTGIYVDFKERKTWAVEKVEKGGGNEEEE